MNKLLIYSTLFAALGLTACSSDEDLSQQGASRKVHVTVNVSRDGVDTDGRTILTENDNHGLSFGWKSTDQIVVTDADGDKVGTLTAKNVKDGDSYGTFEADLILNNDGVQTLNFIYLGTDGDVTARVTNPLVVSIAEQDGTNNFGRKDVMTGQVEVNVKGGDLPDFSFSMKHQVTFGRFELMLPTGVTLNGQDVTISGANVANALSLNTANVVAKGVNGEIVVKNVVGNEFFLTLIPKDNVELNFSVTVDGKEYQGALPAATIKRGAYLNRQGAGIPVQMSPLVTEVELDGSIFGTKWAPSNLRSYIDASPYDLDHILSFSYIPGVPFAEQGLDNLKYVSASVANPENNAFSYMFQWNRPFGFKATTQQYDLVYIEVPNASSIPTNIYNYDWYAYYDSYVGQCNYANGIYNYPVFVWPNNLSDWCSDGENYTTWVAEQAPDNWAFPGIDELASLIPTGHESGDSYTYPATGVSAVTDDFNEVTVYPFAGASCEDGSTVVWSVSKSSEKNYLDIRRLPRQYASLKDIPAEDLVDDDNVTTLLLSADGGLSGGGIQYWQQYGYYWSGETGDQADRAVCFYFYLTGSNKVQIGLGQMPRKFGMSVRCIRK